MSLSSMITDFREEYSRIAASEELGDSLIKACIRRAILRFSRHSGRSNRLADLTINSTDTFLILPSDFLFTPVRELAYGILGITIDSGDLLSILDYTINSTPYYLFDTYDSPLASTAYKPRYWRSFQIPLTVRLGVSDNGAWLIQFNQAFGDTREIKFYYTGIHQLDDGTIMPVVPAKNTIPIAYRDIFLSIVMGYAMEARSRDTLIADEKKALQYQKLAEKCFSRLEELTTLGRRT